MGISLKKISLRVDIQGTCLRSKRPEEEGGERELLNQSTLMVGDSAIRETQLLAGVRLVGALGGDLLIHIDA